MDKLFHKTYASFSKKSILNQRRKRKSIESVLISDEILPSTSSPWALNTILSVRASDGIGPAYNLHDHLEVKPRCKPPGMLL